MLGIGLLGDTLIYAVLPLYHEAFGISLFMVGLLLSLNRWVRLFANSFMASLGERFGVRNLMIGAAVGSTAATTFYGLDGGDGLQIVARMMWGFSFAALNLGSLAYAVADRPNAGKRLGFGRAMIGVFQTLTFVGGSLLVLEIGPRETFLVLGVLTSFSLVVALFLPVLPPEPAQERKGFRLPKPHRLEVWGFLLGFSGDGVFILTLAFLLKDSVSWAAPVVATSLVLAIRCLVESTAGPPGGWLSDRFGARRVAGMTGSVLVLGYVLIALRIDLAGSLVIVLTRGLFNTLIPVMVLERVSSGYLSSQASYSTWRDFGAAVGPLSAPWLFLNFTQGTLFGALAVLMAGGVVFCLVLKPRS